MGIAVNILPIEFDENSDRKFRPITEFKEKNWLEGNTYWFKFLEKIYNINFVFSETNSILFIIYNGQAESFVGQSEYFTDVKIKLDSGIYKKVIVFQNEVNWDTFERILDIENFFYNIFKDDIRFLFCRNIFNSKFNFTKINHQFNFGCFPFQLLHNYNETLEFDYKNSEKNFYLFSANCNIKEERIKLYEFLEVGNYWEKVNTSFFLPLYGNNSNRFNINDFLDKDFLKENISTDKFFLPNLGEIRADINYHPKKLKYDNFNQVKNLALKDSTESLFQIIFETRYHSHCGIVLSEKIFKGFLYKIPFIIFAQHGVLKLLKEFGFKTFDWLVDESYDYELDNKLRINLILSEVDKLMNIPFEELKNKIEEHSADFEHNYELVKKIADKEINKIFKLFYV